MTTTPITASYAQFIVKPLGRKLNPHKFANAEETDGRYGYVIAEKASYRNPARHRLVVSWSKCGEFDKHNFIPAGTGTKVSVWSGNRGGRIGGGEIVGYIDIALGVESGHIPDVPILTSYVC